MNKEEIKNLDRVKRINLINSIVGVRPINLIATQSKKRINNLAIFSSLIHLGSDPAVLGFISRPIGKEGQRDTLHNIKENPFWTINSVHEEFLKQAHYTSAKISSEESEFDICQIEQQKINDFPIPFVKKSKIKIGIQKKEIIPIETNGTSLIVGEITELIVEESAIEEEGKLKNNFVNLLGTIGCSSYYRCEKIKDYPFVREVVDL